MSKLMDINEFHRVLACLDLNQKEFASLAGVTEQTLCNAKKKPVDLITARKIVQAAGRITNMRRLFSAYDKRNHHIILMGSKIK